MRTLSSNSYKFGWQWKGNSRGCEWIHFTCQLYIVSKHQREMELKMKIPKSTELKTKLLLSPILETSSKQSNEDLPEPNINKILKVPMQNSNSLFLIEEATYFSFPKKNVYGCVAGLTFFVLAFLRSSSSGGY